MSDHSEGVCERCGEYHQLTLGGAAWRCWACVADDDEPPEPCTSHARAAGCTCRMESVNSASIDPPEPIVDGWCPLHGGRDPDRERDEMLERARDENPYYWEDDGED